MRKVLAVIIMVLAFSGCATLRYLGHIDTSKLYIGMPAGEIAQAGGHPVRINRQVTGYGTWDQWVFERLFGGYVFVYVDSGKVVSWQE